MKKILPFFFDYLNGMQAKCLLYTCMVSMWVRMEVFILGKPKYGFDCNIVHTARGKRWHLGLFIYLPVTKRFYMLSSPDCLFVLTYKRYRNIYTPCLSLLNFDWFFLVQFNFSSYISFGTESWNYSLLVCINMDIFWNKGKRNHSS